VLQDFGGRSINQAAESLRMTSLLKLLLLMVIQLMHHRTGLCFSHFPELVRRIGIRARSCTLTLKCIAEKSQIDLTTSDSDDAESVLAASSDFNQDDTVEYEVDLLAEEEITEQDSGLPKCYVIISNLQSGSNIGSICRNALAFNVHEVVVVGRKGFRDKMRNADRGAKRRQTFVHFNSVAEAATYLKETKNCSIVGVEILDSAVSSHQRSVRYFLSPLHYLNPSPQNICY
jgi:hypothetical protein